jgi:hypothetical protein
MWHHPKLEEHIPNYMPVFYRVYSLFVYIEVSISQFL